MDINNATLAQIHRNLKKSFADGAAAYTPGVNLDFACTTMPSGGRSNLYPFLDANFRGWREWVGPRQIKETEAKGYELVNKPWENSVAIPADVIDDDAASQLPMYGTLVSGMGAGWAELKYTWQLLGLIQNLTAFDGIAFFATTHKYGKNTIANLAGAFDATTFGAAITAAGAWKFADGMPCRTRITHVIHGPSKYAAVWDVLSKEIVSNSSNPNYKRAERVETDLLTGDYANIVIGIDASKPIKPALRQIRMEGDVMMDTDPAVVNKAGKVDVFGRGRGAYGVTFPHLAYAWVG